MVSRLQLCKEEEDALKSTEREFNERAAAIQVEGAALRESLGRGWADAKRKRAECADEIEAICSTRTKTMPDGVSFQTGATKNETTISKMNGLRNHYLGLASQIEAEVADYALVWKDGAQLREVPVELLADEGGVEVETDGEVEAEVEATQLQGVETAALSLLNPAQKQKQKVTCTVDEEEDKEEEEEEDKEDEEDKDEEEDEEEEEEEEEEDEEEDEDEDEDEEEEEEEEAAVQVETTVGQKAACKLQTWCHKINGKYSCLKRG